MRDVEFVQRFNRSFLRKIVASLMLACAFVLLGCSSSDPSPPTISGTELAERLQADSPGLILDVRSEEEFRQGHIPGAVNVPHSDLARRLPELAFPRDEIVVVYCQSGGRAGQAERILREAGFSDVRDLVGHMQAWREQGFPIEKEQASSPSGF